MPTEVWDAYDQNENKLGIDLIRGEPLPPGVYHIVVEIYTFTENREVLITQRHPDKSWPLKWEITGGSALKGETPLQGALRELQEETGIAVPPDALKPVYTYHNGQVPSIYKGFAAFVTKADTNIHLQAGETVDYRFLPYADFKQFIRTDAFVTREMERFYAHETLFDALLHQNHDNHGGGVQ